MPNKISPRQEDITNGLLQQIADLSLENAGLKSVLSQVNENSKESEEDE